MKLVAGLVALLFLAFGIGLTAYLRNLAIRDQAKKD